MRERGRWDGVLAIARFNWPWYVAAVATIAAAVVYVLLATPNALAWIAVAAAAWLVLGSLAASHWIYDRSDLYRFGWLARAFAGSAAPTRCVFCHAGFDECSGLLARRLPGAEWRVLDHHAVATTTEPSLERARRRQPQTRAEPAPHGPWPIDDAWASAVFGILAIHELRRHEERAAWFREAKRCLAPGGRIVVVEHLRDLWNAVAFGPNVRHFHSVRRWRQSWEAAGLARHDDFRITPFLRVFVLRAP